MPKLRVHIFALSLDGYAAGPDQSLENPIGVNGGRLHEWVFATQAGRQMLGQPDGDDSLDNRRSRWRTTFNFVDASIDAVLEQAWPPSSSTCGSSTTSTAGQLATSASNWSARPPSRMSGLPGRQPAQAEPASLSNSLTPPFHRKSAV
jgi:hypothetical protein